MDIASISTAMAQSKVMQQVSLSVTKKAMDTAEVQMQGVIEMMQAAAPSFGHRLDISV